MRGLGPDAPTSMTRRLDPRVCSSSGITTLARLNASPRRGDPSQYGPTRFGVGVAHVRPFQTRALSGTTVTALSIAYREYPCSSSVSRLVACAPDAQV